jgi:acyl-CoA thioester hydrolase
MPSEFKTRRIVEFADTDAAGILHFSNYFRYMEVAEHRFFRTLGFTVHGKTEDGTVLGFARGQAECAYRRPLRYEDEVEIHVIVRAKMDKSITYECVFRRDDGHGGLEEVARGRMSVVCVAPSEDGGLQAVSIPAPIAAAIEVADPSVGAREVGPGAVRG